MSCVVIKNCYVLLRNFVKNLSNKIQFNNLNINMRLPSLNSFEENQFCEFKKDKYLTQLIWDYVCIRKVRMSKNELKE